MHPGDLAGGFSDLEMTWLPILRWRCHHFIANITNASDKSVNKTKLTVSTVVIKTHPNS